MRTVLLAAAVLVTTPAWAFTKATTSEGKDLHWASSTVTVARDADSVSQTLSTEQIDRALRGALDAWSTLPEARVILTEGPARRAPSGEAVPTGNLIRFRASHWPYAENMLAYTQLYANAETGEILGGTIEFNEAKFRFALIEDGAAGDHDTYDVQAVLTHELGHLLGLGHSTDLTATMFASTAADDTHKRLLAADDRAGLAAVYDQTQPPPSGCSLSPAGPPSRGALAVLVGLCAFVVFRRRAVVVRRRMLTARPRFVVIRPTRNRLLV